MIRMNSTVEFKKPITEKDLEEINIFPEGTYLKFYNTKGLTSDIVKKINPKFRIRILGALNENENSIYSEDKYVNRTRFTTMELYKILTVIEDIESGIDPSWNDLEKAMYIYKVLCENMRYVYHENPSDTRDSCRSLLSLLSRQAVCAGFALVYKELLDRQGIECVYQHKIEDHAWNLIRINGVYYPVDLTWDNVLNEVHNNKCLFAYFGRDREFYDDPHHQIDTGKKYETSILDNVEYQKALNAISNNNGVEKKMGEYTTSYGRKIYFTIMNEEDYKRCIIYSDGIIKNILFDKSINFELALDYDFFKFKANNFVFSKDDKMLEKLKNKGTNLVPFTRSNGTSFWLSTNGIMNNGVISHKYISIVKKENGLYAYVSDILSDIDLSKLTSDIKRLTADILLSSRRVKEKVNKYKGYVGYPVLSNGVFDKFVNREVEEAISGINRW